MCGDPGAHPEVDGYSAVQLGFGIDPRKVNRPEAALHKAGVTPRRHLVELRTEDAGEQ